MPLLNPRESIAFQTPGSGETDSIGLHAISQSKKVGIEWGRVVAMVSTFWSLFHPCVSLGIMHNPGYLPSTVTLELLWELHASLEVLFLIFRWGRVSGLSESSPQASEGTVGTFGGSLICSLCSTILFCGLVFYLILRCQSLSLHFVTVKWRGDHFNFVSASLLRLFCLETKGFGMCFNFASMVRSG